MSLLISLRRSLAQAQDEGVAPQRTGILGNVLGNEAHQLPPATACGSSLIRAPAIFTLRAGPSPVSTSTASALALPASGSGTSMALSRLLASSSLRPPGVTKACAATAAQPAPHRAFQPSHSIH